MIKVIGYIRVSTQLQADKNTQENQKNEIISFANELQLNIVEIYEDIAISGSIQDRPGYKKLLDNIENVDGIVIYDLDRLTRDFETGVKLIFLLKAKKKKLYIARTRSVQDFSDSTNQLINIIYSWVSELERKKIRERQKLGIERFKKENGYWGRPCRKIDWKKYDALVGEKIISKRAFCRMFSVSPATLYRKLKERED